MHWKALPEPGASGVFAGVLFLSVPKRHLARAIDRNLVRRIAREAWRAAGFATLPVAVMVKLRRRPGWFAAAGVRQRRRCLREELDRLFANRALLRLSDTLRGDARP
jgi:RNase P protein component